MNVVLVLFVLLVLGVPLGIAFAFAVMIFADQLSVSMDSLVSVPLEVVGAYPLLAIPLYLLVGEIMKRGGLAERLTRFCDIALRRVRAAYGYIMIAASGLFGSITGSSVATVAAIGAVVGPEMVQRGYPRGYVGALNATAGLLGVLVPPSIPMILYGSLVGVSIVQLFIAAIGPAILMFLTFLFVHNRMSRKVLEGGVETVPADAPSQEELARSARRIIVGALPTLLLPVLILGGIYGGFFTPTESAAVACVYAALLCVFHRSLSGRGFAGALRQTLIASGAVLLVIGMTGIFNRALIFNQLPQELAAYTATMIESRIGFLITANILLILVGMFMETNAAVLLLGPLLAPTAASYGIDPIHFGIILITNVELGLLTPPLAANLFVAARVNDVPLLSMLRYIGFFFLGAVVVQILITFIPVISLWYRVLG